MRAKSTLWVLILQALFLNATEATAQNRLFGGRSRSSSGVNARHERLKNEAQQAYQRGEYETCVERTSTVLNENSRDHVAHYLRGSARVEMGRARGDAKLIREGIADARQAIALEDKSTANYYLPYLYGMTNLASLEKRPEHAEVALEVAGRVLQWTDLKEEDRANILYQRALSHVSLGELDDAAADFQQAIELNQTHLGAFVGLADAYQAAGKHDEALQQFDRTVDAFPSNPLVYNNRGMFRQRQGKLDEAIADFTRALDIDENYVYAYTNRGFALAQQEDYEAAEADFSKSLRLNSAQPMVFSLRAAARLDRGKLEDASADYQRVLEMDDRSAAAHADLAFARFFAHAPEQAARGFQRALERDPKLRYLHPWVLAALETAGQAEQARSQADRALEQAADKKQWSDYLLSYLSGGIDEDALWAAVNTSNPQTEKGQRCEAHFFIGWRKSRLGEQEQAADHYRQAVATEAKHLSAYRGAKFALKDIEAKD